ncbi:MAG: ABC transporter ATP-binding protein [Deltaproteobacteria bacterium RIFOXYD12_FULL_57_12]|nr:MAG: ABC transporter ATP-binding protein [Deltaproteobacteria bacterium RIFOXYD12_FULL_57_12]
MNTGNTNDNENGFLAKGLEKSYDGGGHRIEVLQGVDLQLKNGEMVAIVGVSGTGKTTLLHIFGTLDRPDKGSLTYKGADVYAKNDIELSAFRNRMIGFVFQFHHLLPEFTALENVMMPGLIARQQAEKAEIEAATVLDRVGLANRLLHKVGELSGGEQQRVALARALIMKPALLLADEPTGNLDAKTGNKVFDLIREMSALYSLATVMVTHNMELARRMDRCLTLAEGRLHE